MMILDGKKCNISENILKEKKILKDLSRDPECPQCIIKYIDCYKSNNNYYLIMEDGGQSLFDFIVKAHQLIDIGHFSIYEWHKMVKVIFKQMIECIEWIHSKNICHFDISLENFLINDVDVIHDKFGIKFIHSSVDIKICDFGLAENFGKKSDFISSKFCGKTCYRSPEVTSRDKTKGFNAKSNDIFCLGVCLFMMIIGSSPWKKTNIHDLGFKMIINGQIKKLLSSWNRLKYVNKDILSLFNNIFRDEKHRYNLQQIKQSKWLKSSSKIIQQNM